MVWSAVEINLGIVCNCVVVMRPLVTRHLPWLVKNRPGRQKAEGPKAFLATRSFGAHIWTGIEGSGRCRDGKLGRKVHGIVPTGEACSSRASTELGSKTGWLGLCGCGDESRGFGRGQWWGRKSAPGPMRGVIAVGYKRSLRS